MRQSTRSVLKYSISGYASILFEQIWCMLEVQIIGVHPWLIMGTSRNWHELRSPLYKIRNIQIVDTHALIVHCEFQRVRINGVPLARCQASKNATWSQVTYRDLVTWHLGSASLRFFTKYVNCVGCNSDGKFDGAAPLIRYLRKRGGGGWNHPPAGARVNDSCITHRFSQVRIDANKSAPFYHWLSIATEIACRHE